MLAAQTAQMVLRLPPGQGPRTLQWIFLFHIAFYAVFLPRWLQRQRQKAATPTANAGGEAGGPSAAGASPPPGATPPAAGTTPPATGGTPAAGGAAVPPFPRAPLVLHALAMGVLYYGLDTAVLGLRGSGPWLFTPQPWAGGLVMTAAVALAVAALAVFRSWRLAARLDRGHELCTVGPFRWVRHPIYLAMDLLALGTWLWAPTALVACGVALVALGGDLRARSEEALLLQTFGDAYRRYCATARRFVPGVY